MGNLGSILENSWKLWKTHEENSRENLENQGNRGERFPWGKRSFPTSKIKAWEISSKVRWSVKPTA
jgi:hypothetical protein